MRTTLWAAECVKNRIKPSGPAQGHGQLKIRFVHQRIVDAATLWS